MMVDSIFMGRKEKRKSVVSLSRELFDALFVGQLTDEQSAIVFSHDITVESLHNDLFHAGGMDDAVVGIEKRYVGTDFPVSIHVLGRFYEQRAPCAQIAPSEVGGTDEDFLRFLHDGIVDGYTLTFRIALATSGSTGISSSRIA